MRPIPLKVLLSFPAPNYTNPVTHGPALIIVNAVFMALMTLFLLLRLYTRIAIKRTFGYDDVFIILAYIAATGLASVVLLANTCYGWDRHVWDIPNEHIHRAGIIAFIAKLIFVYASTFTRVSLLCFYYRLAEGPVMTWFKWAVHLNMGFQVVMAFVFTFIGVFLCTPVQAYWAWPTRPGYKCIDEGKVTLAVGIVNCTADLMVTILPIPIVAPLKMPSRQRVSVIVLLSLGFIVSIAGIVRTYFIWKSLIDSYDLTWYAYPLWICAAVEIDLGIICACAPAIRPLLSTALDSTSSSIITDRLKSIFYPSVAADNSKAPIDRKSYHDISHRKNTTNNDSLPKDVELGTLKSSHSTPWADNSDVNNLASISSDPPQKDPKYPSSAYHGHSNR